MSPFERLFDKAIKIKTIVFVIILVILTYTYIDKVLATYLVNLHLKESFTFLDWVTKLGSAPVYTVAFFLAALYFRYIRLNHLLQARCWFLCLCVIVPELLCGVLKVALGRARPNMWFEGHFYGFYGWQTNENFWSFPSGHTTAIMGVSLGLGIIFPRYFYAFVMGAFCVACSRLLLIEHYLSDILATGYLTLIEIGILIYLLKYKGWLSISNAHVLSNQKGNYENFSDCQAGS